MLEFLHPRRRRIDVRAMAVAAGSGALVASAVSSLANARSRARWSDKVTSWATRFTDVADKAARDAKHRAAGAVAEAEAVLRHEVLSDEQLVARVRSQLGRVVSNPHAIKVAACDGHVIVAGPILRAEVRPLLRSVEKTRGVRTVANQLEVHRRPGGVSALQGAGTAQRAPEHRWTPSLRALAALVGAAAIVRGGMRGSRASGLMSVALGTLLFGRALSDAPLTRWLGLGGRRRAIAFEKTMIIHAPIEQVFSYWADFRRFPAFMDHVQRVTKTGDHGSHWEVRGPLGTTIEWDAVITAFAPNEFIAWESADGAPVKHAGSVRFESIDEGRATRLDIRLGYNVAGHLGHTIASMFRVDPKTALDEDMLRFKSLLEQGKASAHGHEISRAIR
ncbi:SRPBCC family protein [Pendulispora brunnea]|uniref:SRPBCC family protein n=1 Tax=Pendulispora brunnea TaxID=2905690 RepID=A0ABZ2K4C9_9BACT